MSQAYGGHVFIVFFFSTYSNLLSLQIVSKVAVSEIKSSLHKTNTSDAFIKYPVVTFWSLDRTCSGNLWHNSKDNAFCQPPSS